jgi:hypothetical protein
MSTPPLRLTACELLRLAADQGGGGAVRELAAGYAAQFPRP